MKQICPTLCLAFILCVLPGAPLFSLNPWVGDASWVVVGTMEVDEDATTEIRIKESDREREHIYSLTHGTIHVDFISQEDSLDYETRIRNGLRLPTRLNVVFHSHHPKPKPLDKQTVWIVKPNASIRRHHAIWEDPERNPKARRVLEEFFALAEEIAPPVFERDYHKRAPLTPDDRDA